MFIPLILQGLERLRTRYAHAAILDELARDPRRLDDLGLDLKSFAQALSAADRRPRAPVPEERVARAGIAMRGLFRSP